MSESPNEPSLASGTRLLSLCIIGTSLILNILALALPFMKLRKGIGKEPYSLLNSVALLWEKGLYVLVLLVVGFSIVFPFLKLGVLAWIACSRGTEEKHLKLLHGVEVLGKWSMLDAFLVSIILALASNQLFVDGTPLIGLSCFILAILLSMVAGEILARNLLQMPDEIDGPPEDRSVIWVILSGLALAGAIAIPFLSIQDWILKNREYSIISLVPVLFEEGAWLAGMLVACFLVLAPVVGWMASLVSWRKNRKGILSPEYRYWIRIGQRWNMLPVFGLAFVIFALESDELMKTEIRWGALFLGGVLALQMAFSSLMNRKLQ